MIVKIFHLFVVVLVFYLFLAFFTFDPSDPGWTQTLWDDAIHNITGKTGAWLADFFFVVFGISSYYLPFLFLFFFWDIFVRNGYVGSLLISFKLIGILSFVFSSCGLISLNIEHFYYFCPGGVLGDLLMNVILIWLNRFTGSLLLLCFWILGFVLLTSISFSKIFQNISWLFIRYLMFFYHYLFRFIYFFYERIKILLSILLNYNYNTNISPFQVKRFFNFKEYILYSKKNIDNTVSKIYLWNYSIDSFLNINMLFFDRFNCLFVGYFKVLFENFSSRVLSQENVVQDLLNDIFNFKLLLNTKKMVIFSSILQFSDVQNNSKSKIIKKIVKDKKMFADVMWYELYFISKHLSQNNFFYYRGFFLRSMWSIITANLVTINHTVVINNQNCSYDTLTSLPDVHLLIKPSLKKESSNSPLLNKAARLLETALADYNIAAKVVNILSGPVVDRFELHLASGVKVARISNLSRDLARILSKDSVRVIEVISGKSYIGLEVPNNSRQKIYLYEILSSHNFKNNSSPLTLALGKNIVGEIIISDLIKMPHLLIAGTTGSGKSMGINVMILSILYKSLPEDVRFIMIDPKILELSVYEGIPHLLTEVITDMHNVPKILSWCVEEIDRRYKLMLNVGVKNLIDYNKCINVQNIFSKNNLDEYRSKLDKNKINKQLISRKLPYIVIIIDELADLMIVIGKQVEKFIVRIAQKGRAAGVHLLLSTQRPSVDVITGLIKANIPSRIAFTLPSRIDSYTIINQSGAELLLGMGDMLYLASNSSVPIRVHSAFVSDEEIRSVVNHWKRYKV